MVSVTITNSMIDTLSGRKDLHSVLPFLKLKTAGKGCCNKKKRMRPAYEAIKMSIVTLSTLRLDILKRGLSADKVVVFVRRGGNKTERIER